MMDKLILEIPTRLETERLVLRRYEPGDGAWYFAMSMKNKAHLQEFEAGNALMSINSLEEAENLVQRFAANWDSRHCFYLGAFDKASGEFVAQIYIGPVNWNLPEFEIGYFVDKDHEGKGFVSEAVRTALAFIFGDLHAKRVSLYCNPRNVRSSRVAERCSFVLEGHIRENFQYPDGTVNDTLCYGLLRREFEARQRQAEPEIS